MRSFVPLLLLASFLPSLSFAQGRRVAVFVGVSQYRVPSNSPDKGGYSSLSYAHKDAQRLGDAFRSLGWETKVLHAPPGATTSEATKSGILDSVRSLSLGADDTLLFFFSGHGNRLGGRDYLVPFDAEWSGGKPDPGTLLSFDELQSVFETLGAGARIVMVDACRDAPRSKGEGNDALDPSLASAKLGEMARASRSGAVSWIAMLACGPGEQSYEDSNLGAGVFASAVLEALGASSSIDAQGNLRPELMMDTVRERVRAWSRTKGLQTEPRLVADASRPIYLGNPASSRAVALAARVAELLRASWDERSSDLTREAGFREVLLLDPAKAEAYRGLGEIYRRERKYAEAETFLKDALRLDPKDSDAHDELGLVYWFQSRYAESEASYKEAIRLDPGDGGHYEGLGDLYKRQGKYAEAEASYKEAVRLLPAWQGFRLKLADFYMEQRRYQEAEAAFRYEIQIYPEDGWMHDRLADALNLLERFSEAEASYKEARRLSPDSEYIAHSLASFYHEQKKYPEAEEAYREAIRLTTLTPQWAHWHRNLGEVCFLQKKYIEAEASYKEALRLDSDRGSWHDELGSLYLLQGKFSDAESSFRQAIEHSGMYEDSGRFHGNLAKALLSQGKKSEARKSAIRAKELGYTDKHLFSQLGIR